MHKYNLILSIKTYEYSLTPPYISPGLLGENKSLLGSIRIPVKETIVMNVAVHVSATPSAGQCLDNTYHCSAEEQVRFQGMRPLYHSLSAISLPHKPTLKHLCYRHLFLSQAVVGAYLQLPLSWKCYPLAIVHPNQ